MPWVDPSGILCRFYVAFCWGCNCCLAFYAGDVASVAGVDLDELVLVDEQRHAHCSAGLDCSGLESVCGGVTLDAGLGVGDAEHGLDGHLGIEHCLGGSVGHNLDGVAFLHKGRAGDELLVDRNLLESLVVHEDVVAALAVEELVGTTLYAHVFELFTNVETALEHTAVYNVFQLGTHECVTLSRLHVEKLHAEVQTAIHADAGAVLNVLSVNHIG